MVYKEENNIVVEKYFLSVCMGAYWKKSVSSFFEGNMDGQKYVSILENNINKIKEMLQKLILQWNYNSKHRSNVSLKFYIKTI